MPLSPRAKRGPLDLIILDIGLPDIDGVEVCRRVRQFSDAHVLTLAAQDTELDKVVGFEPCLLLRTKPFSIAELVGRVKAALPARHSTASPARPTVSTMRTFGSLTVDPLAREATLDGAALELTRLRVRPARHASPPSRGVAFSRAQLLERVWGAELVRRRPPRRRPRLQSAPQASRPDPPVR